MTYKARLLGSALALLVIATVLSMTAPAQAAFPGRNGLIAFVRGGNLYTASSSGADVRQLTTTGGLSGPRWSPDGERLAYRGQGGAVFVRTLESGATRRVGDGALGAVSWTRDGDDLAWIAEPTPDAYCSNGQPLVGAGVYTAPADGSGPTTLLYDFHEHGWTDCDVTVESLQLGGFSMDGATMTFSLCSSYGSASSVDCGMWAETAPFGAGSSRQVTSAFCYDDSFESPCVHLSAGSFGPGGNGIVFSGKGDDLPGSSDTAAQSVFAVDASGTGLHRVSTRSSGYGATFSPSGGSVLFTSRTGSGTAVFKSGVSASSAAVLLIPRASQPDWQPVP